ncbi:MAG: hypothetical protein WCA45_06145 [Thiobacillaceae bacterium]
MNKTAGWILLTVGLILGPGYFIYTRFYTGREITELPLSLQPISDRRARALASFDLLPVMGPITLTINLTATHGPTLSPPKRPRNRYQARVILNGETVLTHTFTVRAIQVEATPAEVFKVTLPVMTNLAPGEYKLELTQEDQAEMEIKQASVQVRAGVTQANPAVLAVGVGLLLTGAVIIPLAP